MLRNVAAVAGNVRALRSLVAATTTNGDLVTPAAALFQFAQTREFWGGWNDKTQQAKRAEATAEAKVLAKSVEYALADTKRSNALVRELSPEGRVLLAQLVNAQLPKKAHAGGKGDEKEQNGTFEHFDVNHDGKLSKEEFQAFTEKFKIEPRCVGALDALVPTKYLFFYHWAHTHHGEMAAPFHTRNEENDQLPRKQLLLAVVLATSIPYVAFGFMDNFLMIIAGEAIDHHLSKVLGLSTLAAAGFGNLISDLAGVAAADTIERKARTVGFKEPILSEKRASKSDVVYARMGGAMAGISVGCIIGMFPLGLGLAV